MHQHRFPQQSSKSQPARAPKIRAADARAERGIQKIQLWHTECWHVDFPFQPSLTSVRGGVKNHNSFASGEELLFE